MAIVSALAPARRALHEAEIVQSLIPIGFGTNVRRSGRSTTRWRTTRKTSSPMAGAYGRCVRFSATLSRILAPTTRIFRRRCRLRRSWNV